MKKQNGFSIEETIIFVLIAVLLLYIIGAFNQPPKITSGQRGYIIDVSNDPYQKLIWGAKPFSIRLKNKDYQLYPVADYKLSGVFLTKNIFFINDPASDIAPIDVGVAWGNMAVPEYYEYITISSSARRLTYNTLKPNPPFKPEYIQSHISHNHVIPATPNVLLTLKSLRKYQKVMFEGLLVNLKFDFDNCTPDKSYCEKTKFERDTSLVRGDTGCEVFYIQKVWTEAGVYQ